MSLSKFKSSVSTLVVGLAGVAAVSFCLTVAQWQLNTAWRVHVERLDVDLQVKGERIGYRMQTISDSLRAIASTTGVRRIESGNQMLGPLDFDNVSQIVTKLSSKFVDTQVYVVSKNFNPERLDPETGILQAPAICINCTKFNVPEVEAKTGTRVMRSVLSTSQRQTIADQSEWFRRRFYHRGTFSGLDTPVISSGRVGVVEQTAATHKSLNFGSHVIFSVPFYDNKGLFAGIVSAAIPTTSLNKVVPYGPYAIESPTSEYRSNALTTVNADPNWKPSFWKVGGDGATFGALHNIEASDPRGQWSLHARHGAISFYQSPEFLMIKQYASWAILFSLLLAGLGMAWVYGAHRKARQLRHNATHDALTGLPNRVLLQNLLQLSLNDSLRKKSSAMLLYLDLDRFKLVNDTLGHHVGDMVLQEAGRIISGSIRNNDVLARMGGDEFVVLMRDGNDPVDATFVAGRIIDNISKPMHLDGHVINIGTSIGISVLRGDDQSVDDIIRCADLALFRAKTEERGSYRFYESDMDAERLRRRQLEMDLRQAVSNQQLILHYQPIINALTGDISGFEALLRWQHPERGLIPPLEFIPLAEELGLINKIGEWVLNEACRGAMELPENMQIAVNVSVQQIKTTGFPLQVLAALNNSGLAPQRLELELTESIMATGDATVLFAVKQLRSIGVRIALDDFGVGFSSFGCLKDFEFDRIKIDRSFLRNVERSKESAIFHAIANIGAELGVATTAEGVETEAQLKAVLAQGCTEAQGYYFCKPKPIHEVADFVRSHAGRPEKSGGKKQ